MKRAYLKWDFLLIFEKFRLVLIMCWTGDLTASLCFKNQDCVSKKRKLKETNEKKETLLDEIRYFVLKH